MMSVVVLSPSLLSGVCVVFKTDVRAELVKR